MPRRDGRPYRRLRQQVKALGLPCALCGRAIDYNLEWNDESGMAFTLHHPIPLAAGGPTVHASNAVPAHRICNIRQGNMLENAFDMDGHTPGPDRSPSLGWSRQW